MVGPLDQIGAENANNGICGFTCALQSLYEQNQQWQARIEAATEAQAGVTRWRAEILTYLNLVRAADGQELLDEIQAFTRSFGQQYVQWTVEGFREQMRAAADGDLNPYGIALPPNAVVDYLGRVYQLNAQMEDLGEAADMPNGPAIVGMRTDDRALLGFNGLAHYVYVQQNGQISSWGQPFNNLADLNQGRPAGRAYHPRYSITVVG